MDRKLVVALIVGGGLLLLIAIILGITLSHKSPSVPVCHCTPDEVCNAGTGVCTKRISCGPKMMPSGAQCTIDQLKCDVSTDFLWVCSTCPPNREGKYCNCDSATRKNFLSNVCQLPTAMIPICQDDGTWSPTPQPAPTCAEINKYLLDVGQTLDDACGKVCGTGYNTTCVETPTAHVGCENACAPLPADGSTPCKSPACSANEECICDTRTNYRWGCSPIWDPSCPTQDCCPPTDPAHSYCHDGSTPPHNMALQCVPCAGGKGYMQYCMGTQHWPASCMVLDTNQTVEGQSYRVDTGSGSLPVFPLVDNDLCKTQTQTATSFVPEYDDSWQMVGNPKGFVYGTDLSGNRHFKEFKADNSMGFYPNTLKQQTQPVYCWWDIPSSVCTNGQGTWTQQCGPTATNPTVHDCRVDELDNRLPPPNGYRCNCLMQPGSNPPKSYLGSECQYSDTLTCNNNGVVPTDGSCICNDQFFGAHCETNVRAYCNRHGTYDKQKQLCVCDNGYAGSSCVFSRDGTCSGHGTPDYNGNCACDDGWLGGNCSFDTSNPSTAWVGTCYCASGISCVQSGITNQDPDKRANCYFFPSDDCNLGPTSQSAQQGCDCGGC